MKPRLSFRSSLILRVVSFFMLGFVLISIIVSLFFRSAMRNIGYSLSFASIDEAALRVTEYIGDPPSRIRARMLTWMYNIAIAYRRDQKLVWAVGRIDVRFRAAPMMKGMMMSRSFERQVYLARDRILSIYFPMHLRRHLGFFPLLLFGMSIALIGVIIFLSVRKALRPVGTIIEAAERIGRGDLSYRIHYSREDDFKKVALAFNAMAEKLGSMLKGQRELLHFISHELRTPLARINLALELKESKRSREIIKQEIHEIDTLVGSVIELSRMEKENEGEEGVPIDLVSLLDALVEKYEKNPIRFHSEPNRAVIKGSDVFIKKAFLNLIDNSVKYSADALPVSIDLRESKDYYEVAIENSGPGISEKEIDRVWEPFFRGKNSLLNRTQGKGLGLTIVQKAVRQASGTISVKSAPEGPTIFTVRLPKHIPARQERG